MRTALILVCWTLLTVLTPSPIPAAEIEEQDPAYYHTGRVGRIAPLERAAAVVRRRSAAPLESTLCGRHHPSQPAPFRKRRASCRADRRRGPDRVFRLGRHHVLGRTGECRAARTALLDQFLGQGGEKLSTDPLKRVLLQHDLWTLFDFLMIGHIARRGDLETRHRRNELCRKLARAIQCAGPPARNAGQASRQLCPGHSIGAVRRDARL